MATTGNTASGSNRRNTDVDIENHVDEYHESDLMNSTNDEVARDLDSMSADDIYLTLLRSGGDYYAAESPSPGSPELDYRPSTSVDGTTKEGQTDSNGEMTIGLNGNGDRTVVMATSSASDDDHVIVVDSGWRPRVSRPKLSAHEDGLLTLTRSGTLPVKKSKNKYNPVLTTSSPPQQCRSAKSTGRTASPVASRHHFKRSKSDGVDPASISSVNGVGSSSKTRKK